MRRAACVAVGSELLGSHRLDRNSLTISEALARHGVSVVEKRVLGDDLESVAASLRELSSAVDLVVVTGGLGPTADDLTRQALAVAVGHELVADPEAAGWIRERYRSAGRTMPGLCLEMAKTIPGARLLRNDRGSAPGMLLDVDQCLVALFPGVPWEMEEMLERDLLPVVAERGAGRCRDTRTLLLGGVIESETEERIRHLYPRYGRDNVTILAAYGALRLELTATGDPHSAAKRLDEMEAGFREVLGDDIAGVGIASLAEAVLVRARAAGLTVATAESCTGGLVAAWITDIAGSSDVYQGGVVSYSNRAKQDLLGVSEALLVEHGAVSEAVAVAMAEGARRTLAADWGLAITGIAGPGGGSEGKPVGLVHWAVAGAGGSRAEHRVFQGSRSIVRQYSANAALDLLRRCLGPLRVVDTSGRHPGGGG